MTNGRFLLGKIGSSRAISLSKKLEQKTLSAAKIHEPGIENYSPFLCDTKEFNQLRRAISGSTEYVSDFENLAILDDVFINPEKSGLKHFALNYDPEKEFIHFDIAKDRLARSSLQFNNRLNQFCKTIVSVTDSRQKTRAEGIGLSTVQARGAIFLSTPTSNHPELDLAVNLAHELGHQSLFTYQLADNLLRTSPCNPVYSVVRQTERPAIMSFHAMTAVAFMLEYISIELSIVDDSSEKEFFSEKYLENIDKLRVALEVFNGYPLTNLGQAIYNEFFIFYRSLCQEAA